MAPVEYIGRYMRGWFDFANVILHSVDAKWKQNLFTKEPSIQLGLAATLTACAFSTARVAGLVGAIRVHIL